MRNFIELELLFQKNSNCKEPEEGFVLQESSSTSARSNSDFTATSITSNDVDFDKTQDSSAPAQLQQLQ